MPAMNGKAQYEIGGSATPEEAAAVVAAIENFLADTTVAPLASGEVVSGWQRAGLYEAVGLTDPDALW